MQSAQQLLPTSAGAPSPDGQRRGIQGTRLAPRARFGRGRIGALAWNQKRFGQSNAVEKWFGQNIGIRQPDQDETALSDAEVTHAMTRGLL